MVSSTIFTIILACVIAIIVTDINSKKANVETAIAEKAETMQEQEEQNMPKAITTPIVAGTPNANNVTYVDSEELDENLNPKKVPVPKGYVASPDAEERYVNGVTTDGVREHHGGFVIYERLASDAGKTDAEVREIIKSNIDEAQRTRNQWVWVPIADVTDMYHVSGNLIYANQYTFSASTYTKNTSRTYEPNVLTRYDNANCSDSSVSSSNKGYLKQYLEGISRNEFLQEMREEFYEMIESVKTYGGFYIGRYETGNTQKNNLRVVKGFTGTTSSGSANNRINYITWYNAYKRSKAIRGRNPVKTGLIWGIQWDETLKWIIDSGEKTYAEVGNDSSSWGNFANVSFTYTQTSGVTADGVGTIAGGTTTKGTSAVIIPTGSTERNKANNIYDLAGNMKEWTMEANTLADRMTRGDRYDNGSGVTGVGERNRDSPQYSHGYRRMQGDTLHFLVLSVKI